MPTMPTFSSPSPPLPSPPLASPRLPTPLLSFFSLSIPLFSPLHSSPLPSSTIFCSSFLSFPSPCLPSYPLPSPPLHTYFPFPALLLSFPILQGGGEAPRSVVSGNNLTLNVNKTKEMIVDFRKQQREHPPPPIHIDGTVVERVESFKFLSVHITDKLNWSNHTDSVVKKAQQCLFNLRRQKKFGLSPKTLTNFYRCTIESILLGYITAWYGNCSAHNRKALQRVVRSAQRITGGKLPALQDTYTTRCHRKAIKTIKDSNHPSHCLFTPLSSRRQGQYWCIKAGAERMKNSFYLKAIRLLNSHH
ncbi:uncharacterized protein ACWYII_026277 [Salvelinus alpinus]